MKSTIKDWLKVCILLLDEAAAVGLVLIVLWALRIEIPVPIAVVAALVFGGLVFVIHKAVIPSLHRKQVTGAEGLIGLEGEVIEPLTPVGVIKINDEYWKAKSVGENVAAGGEVEILGMNGLTLMVKRKV